MLLFHTYMLYLQVNLWIMNSYLIRYKCVLKRNALTYRVTKTMSVYIRNIRKIFVSGVSVFPILYNILFIECVLCILWYHLSCFSNVTTLTCGSKANKEIEIMSKYYEFRVKKKLKRKRELQYFKKNDVDTQKYVYIHNKYNNRMSSRVIESRKYNRKKNKMKKLRIGHLIWVKYLLVHPMWIQIEIERKGSQYVSSISIALHSHTQRILQIHLICVCLFCGIITNSVVSLN